MLEIAFIARSLFVQSIYFLGKNPIDDEDDDYYYNVVVLCC